MRKQKKGVIINTASISGIRGDYGMASYNAAKAGLVNLTRTMAIDHARETIHVVSVCPGFMSTPMTHGVVTGNTELETDLFESIPMGRGGDPKEIARAVLFLASDDASYVTGHRKKSNTDKFDLHSLLTCRSFHSRWRMDCAESKSEVAQVSERMRPQ
jgi:meso-butanediol dehydrogenase/(S,S)-butanediol dehydrogenase/diacetyl reductase